jgi:hypothetical protein
MCHRMPGDVALDSTGDVPLASNGGAITVAMVVQYMSACLGTLDTIALILRVPHSTLGPTICHDLLIAWQLQRRQAQLGHSMLEVMDNYLWKQRDPGLSAQFRAAREQERLARTAILLKRSQEKYARLHPPTSAADQAAKRRVALAQQLSLPLPLPVLASLRGGQGDAYLKKVPSEPRVRSLSSFSGLSSPLSFGKLSRAASNSSLGGMVLSALFCSYLIVSAPIYSYLLS